MEVANFLVCFAITKKYSSLISVSSILKIQHASDYKLINHLDILNQSIAMYLLKHLI